MSTGQHPRRLRVDERRYDPEDRNAIRAGAAVCFVFALMVVIALVARIA